MARPPPLQDLGAKWRNIKPLGSNALLIPAARGSKRTQLAVENLIGGQGSRRLIIPSAKNSD